MGHLKLFEPAIDISRSCQKRSRPAASCALIEVKAESTIYSSASYICLEHKQSIVIQEAINDSEELFRLPFTTSQCVHTCMNTVYLSRGNKMFIYHSLVGAYQLPGYTHLGFQPQLRASSTEHTAYLYGRGLPPCLGRPTGRACGVPASYGIRLTDI